MPTNVSVNVKLCSQGMKDESFLYGDIVLYKEWMTFQSATPIDPHWLPFSTLHVTSIPEHSIPYLYIHKVRIHKPTRDKYYNRPKTIKRIHRNITLYCRNFYHIKIAFLSYDQENDRPKSILSNIREGKQEKEKICDFLSQLLTRCFSFDMVNNIRRETPPSCVEYCRRAFTEYVSSSLARDCSLENGQDLSFRIVPTGCPPLFSQILMLRFHIVLGSSNGPILASLTQTFRTTAEKKQYFSNLRKQFHNEKYLVSFVPVEQHLPRGEQLTKDWEELLYLCSPSKPASYKRRIRTWLNLLQRLNWLNVVFAALNLANRLQKWMLERLGNKSNEILILYEESRCPLWTCVIVSLVQLLLHSHCRTMEGFQGLLLREWYYAGYPFGESLRNLDVRNTGLVGPHFNLFLDCVFQLKHRFLCQFEFTEAYLVFLLDVAYSKQCWIFAGQEVTPTWKECHKILLWSTHLTSDTSSALAKEPFFLKENDNLCIPAASKPIFLSKYNADIPAFLPLFLSSRADIEFWHVAYLRYSHSWMPMCHSGSLNTFLTRYAFRDDSRSSSEPIINPAPESLKHHLHRLFPFFTFTNSFPLGDTENGNKFKRKDSNLNNSAYSLLLETAL